MKKVMKLVTVKAKRVDWTKKAGTVVRERSLVKTELDRKDARIAELTGKLGAVVTRVAELAKEKEALAEQHKQAVEAGLRACEEVKGCKDTAERLNRMYHELKETYLETRDERDELKKELNVAEEACEKAEKDFERVLALSRKLHEAVGSMLNGV